MFVFEKNECKSASTTRIYHESSDSRNSSVTNINCCQEESRDNDFIFSLPLTILLLSMVPLTATYYRKTDENCEHTPQLQQKKQPFYLSRTVKAAKRKANTEAARAEPVQTPLISNQKQGK